MSIQKDTYTNLSKELDEVLETLQNGDLDIDKAVALYERGLQIATKLQAHLKTAKNKVEKLKVSFRR